MANGADFQIDGFHRAEGPFYSGEIFVCLHRVRGIEVLTRHAGANDIDAIKLGLSRDLIDLASPSEVAVADVEGEVLATLSFQDANIDNMEGLAVRRGPNGETFLYVISDDNYWRLQRTLLLMFEVKN